MLLLTHRVATGLVVGSAYSCKVIMLTVNMEGCN